MPKPKSKKPAKSTRVQEYDADIDTPLCALLGTCSPKSNKDEKTPKQGAAAVASKDQLARELIAANVDNVRLRRRIDELQRRVSTSEGQRNLLVKGANVLQAWREALEATLPALEYVRPNPGPVKSVPKGVKVVNETLMIHVSDEHFGQVVEPTSVNGLEQYNVPIALRRGEVYMDRVIEFATRTLVNYRFEDVIVLFYGDHVNGDIHGGEEYSHYRNSFATCIAAGQMHGLMIRELANAFPAAKIRVVYVPGNHGRKTKFKDMENPLRNQDYLVAEVAACMCRNLPIEFVVPNAFSINLKVYDYVFNISHGDSVKAWNGIPWYGIERRSRRLQAIHAVQGGAINYQVMGHFHQAATASDPVGETIVNGSWKATDPFIYNELGGYSRPVQWIHGIHERHGITWRLAVDLKSPGEQAGPQRFKIDFAADEYKHVAKLVNAR